MSFLKIGSNSAKEVEEKNLSISCQLTAVTDPSSKEKTMLAIMPNFFNIRLSRLTGVPSNASGIRAVQSVFDRTATRKLTSKKIRVMTAVTRPIMIFVTRGLMKTSVCPTSANHHQSVTKVTIVENEKKRRKIIAIPIPEKSLVFFITTTKTFRVLAGCN